MRNYDNSWQFTLIHRNSWKFMTVDDNSRQFVTIHEDLWQLMRIFDNSWHFDNSILITHNDYDSWQFMVFLTLGWYGFILVNLVKVLTVESTCLCRLLIYTNNDFQLILGFNYSLPTMLFTLNLDSRKGYLHRKWF